MFILIKYHQHNKKVGFRQTARELVTWDKFIYLDTYLVNSEYTNTLEILHQNTLYFLQNQDTCQELVQSNNTA